CELERINAIAVHDAIQIDVADVTFGREFRFHLLEGGIEQLVRAAPEHCRAHLACGRTDVAGEELLVLEVNVEWIDELLSVEERADCHLHTGHAPLQLELPDLVRKGLLVCLEYADYVLAVVLITDEEATLHISSRPRRLDDVTLGILLHICDRVIEILEVAIGHNVDAFLLELLLAEGTIVLEPISVRRAADYHIALRSERLRLLALAERVV